MPDAPTSICMAFDFGTRKIGVAVGQALTGTVTGIASVTTLGRNGPWDRIDELVREWRPERLIVGLPLDNDGRDTTSSKAARAFGDALGKRLQLPVYWQNEYLTSQTAQAQLVETVQRGKRFTKRKQSGRDLLAAELILRSHLESTASRR
jgi:putative Holliday junction resolvase